MSTQPTPQPDDSQAPNVVMPQDGSAPSVLSQTIGSPQMPTLAGSQDDQEAAEAAPSKGSRLLAILSAVSKVGETALSSIPDKGRSTFVTGLGQGARAQQAAEATQQAIKFRSFDDSLRAANLHHQDQELQMRTQAQADAHQRFQDEQHDWNEAHGIEDTIIPNDGDAVVDHLTAQTAGLGAATIPAGTHLSADGTSIHVPTDTQSTRDGQLKQYKTFAPIYGLPSLPESAQFVPPRLVDALTHTMQGYGVDGTPISHDVLPQKIAALQAQRDQLAKNRATPDQLKALDGTIGILKANQKALDDHQAEVFKQQQAQQLDTLNKSEAIKAKYAEQKQDNAAANKPQPDKMELNAVAFDPNYQNADGSKGANVVMNKADAQAKGLTHYKADPSAINSLVGGFNDVQNKINMLADIANDPKRMGQVDPGNAAAILAHDKGIDLGAGAFGAHLGIDTSRFNEKVYAAAVDAANQATMDFVTAYAGAHEAITQLPRLQTFGKSNRMTEKQMEAAINLLPHPGDGRMAQQKMVSLQQMLDPLRKQVPHMPGADSTPSWMERRRQTSPQQTAPQQQTGESNLGRAVSNPTDYINLP